MCQKYIYKINIQTWNKHNGSKKKNHRYFLFENRFFQDESISQLKPIEALFYIYLLTIASDLTSSSFEITTQSIPRSLRINNTSLSNYLESLQSLQLVTYEKMTPNRREEKRKEYNIIEDEVRKNNNNQSQDSEKTEKQKPVFEIAKTENTNSVQGFHARFLDSQKESPFLKTLEEWDLKKPFFKNNLHLLEKTFETNEKFVEWLGHIVTRPGYQKAKAQGAFSADNYITKALKSEMGLAL